MREPGVVSVSPVSSHVFRPDRIIGHPPYSSAGASGGSWSWTTVSRHESPTGSISHVTRDVPARSASGPHSARIVCASRTGRSTTRFSPYRLGHPAAQRPLMEGENLFLDRAI